MKLSMHIRELRQRDGLSQEALASRIFVTRQTVSNWETGRSYPDVQSLLLLSALFNVSIDELVKGDIQNMKNELEVYKLNIWSWVMAICLVVGCVGALPMAMAFGRIGLIPSATLFLIGMVAAITIERMKKKRNLDTYAEVVAFLEGKAADPEKVLREKNRKGAITLVKLFGGAVVGLILVLVGWFIGSVFIN